ncbi:hypothetical protein [Candidatus Poriferisodalis sp.]|uniref:hypothetical protein n=1 Tax=Candidatus Poriferisodalis sp. TaxID=3101277 RepID=UPI003B0130A0
MTGEPACHHDLLRFATSFETLYLARIRADYDHRYHCTKRDADDAIAGAQNVISALADAATSCREQLDLVAIAMMADDRNRKYLRVS